MTTIGYEYSHNFEGGWVAQDYLGETRRYYEPVERGYEAEIKRRLDALREKRGQAERSNPPGEQKPNEPA